ncbi:MAG: hypothetical protein LR015_10720 [Verrucomicrobia bacterium]|nr:hypothetical protein [Verrucomicrobiota bacterium]
MKPSAPTAGGTIQACAREFIPGDNLQGQLQRLELRTQFHNFSFFVSDIFEPFEIADADPNLSYRFALVQGNATSMEGPTPFELVPDGASVAPPGDGTPPLYTFYYYPLYRFPGSTQSVPVRFVNGEPVEITPAEIEPLRIDFFSPLNGRINYSLTTSTGVTFDSGSNNTRGIAQDGATLNIARIRETFVNVRMLTIETETAPVVAPVSGTLRSLASNGGVPSSNVLFNIANPPTNLRGEALLPIGSPFELVAALDVNNDSKADLFLRDRVSGNFYLHLSTFEAPAYENAGIPLFANGTAWEFVHVADFSGDQFNEAVFQNRSSGEVRIVSIASGVAEERSIGTSFGSSDILGFTYISNSRDVPPQANRALAPWTNAMPVNATPVGDGSDRWFFVENFGFLYDDGTGFVYTTEHGFWYVWSESAVSNDIWAYDFAMETWFWVNTFGDVYPWMYMLDPSAIIGDGWVYFFPTTETPNRFFAVPILDEFGLDPIIGESDLRDIITGNF